MANTRQQQRRKIRDRKKSWAGVVSSVKAIVDENMLSEGLLHKMVTQARDLNLMTLALIGLEALKARGHERIIERLTRANSALEQQIIKARTDLAESQRVIANMNTRYIRRGSKQARVQHPEKRRGR